MFGLVLVTTWISTMSVLFPKYSTNLVVGVSNSGKSYLIQHFLSTPERYFEQVPENIYIVHCNNQTPEYNLSLVENDIQVHQIFIDEFDLNRVEPNSILVFEDVNKLHETIKIACNVATHHLPLLSLFIVSQGVTGNNHFDLVKIVHRLIFCLGSTTASKAADFIINFFFQDSETKTYLKKVLKFAEKQDSNFLLKLNSIASRPSPFIACTHFLHNFDYYLTYTCKNLPKLPNYIIKDDFKMEFDNLDSEKVVDVPENTYVVMPFKKVQEQLVSTKKKPETDCAGPDLWDKVLNTIYATIEQNLTLNRWRSCKSLARSVMDCKAFCVTRDGRFLSLKTNPHDRVVFFDFINDITRQIAPKERLRLRSHPDWKIYKTFIPPLREFGISRLMLKNVNVFKKT